MEISYSSNKLTVGLNHGYQSLVNTDVDNQEVVSTGPAFDKNAAGWYSTNVDANGRTFYTPTSNKQDTVRFNAIKDQITLDGKTFLNLQPHISKLYFDWEFLPNVVLHSDIRIFWGMLGTKDLNNYKKTTTVTGTTKKMDTTYVIQPDNSVVTEIDTTSKDVTTSTSTSPYLDERGYSDNTVFNTLDISTSPMFKWNASLHWNPTPDLTISAFVYDILGVDNGTTTDNSLAINTLRWQQIGNSKEQTDLYGMDLRSYAVRISKSF
jgi:hypothetical protein